jgi:hypothetical protein
MKEIVRPGLQDCRYPPKLLQQVVTLVVIGHVTQRIREGQTHLHWYKSAQSLNVQTITCPRNVMRIAS